MQKMRKFLLVFGLCVCLACSLAGCSNAQTNWLSPMMNATMTESKLEVCSLTEYCEATAQPTEQNPSHSNHVSARVAALNNAFVDASSLVQHGAKRLTLNLEYGGAQAYKVRFGYRVDLIESEQTDSQEVVMGHGIAAYGVQNHVDVLYNVHGTWYNNTYGSSAESGGELVFGEGYCDQTDPKFSATRRAILLNSDTASTVSTLDFYVVGLQDGFYVLNLYVEREDDAAGHFHGLQILAMTSVVITVGQPQLHGGEAHA